MPPGTGVVDAFKSTRLVFFIIFSHHLSADLIRHGKHHHHHHSLRHTPPPPAKTPPAREAAEIIVDEERRERSKMPTYKGLEQFKLTEKMGEFVSFFLFFFLCTLPSSPSKRRLFKCLPGSGICQWQKRCWSVLFSILRTPSPHISLSQSRPQIRAQCFPGKHFVLALPPPFFFSALQTNLLFDLILRAALLLEFTGRRQASEPQVQEKAARYRGALCFNLTCTVNVAYSYASSLP